MAVSDSAPDYRRFDVLGRPGAKLVFVAFPGEMVKPAAFTTEGAEVHGGAEYNRKS